MHIPAPLSPFRAVTVTAGLAIAGAVLGGGAGALALGIALVLSTPAPGLADLFDLVVPAFIGAFLGFFAAPLAGWLLLRRVPLGRAFGGLLLGTVLGGLAGWFLMVGTEDIPFTEPILSAVAGFLIAAVYMRIRYQDTPWRERSQLRY